MLLKARCQTHRALFYAYRNSRSAENSNFVGKAFDMSDEFVNKVAESGLISFDLEAYYPKGPVKVFDLKEYLFMGLILKEKDFRAALQSTDWENYKDANVAITCTADAIIPMWAFFLLSSHLQPYSPHLFFCDYIKLIISLLLYNLHAVIF